MSELKENYDFYGKVFAESYPKFVNKLSIYAKKYNVELSENLKYEKEKECLVVCNIAVYLDKKNEKNMFNEIENEEKFTLGLEDVDIKPLWNKLNKKEKNKISVFVSLLKKVSKQITDSVLNGNSEFLNNLEVINKLFNKKPKNFSVNDLDNNSKALDNLNKSSEFTNMEYFKKFANDFLSSMDIDSKKLKKVLAHFKKNENKKMLEKSFHEMLSKTLGKENYNSTIKPLMNDAFTTLRTSLNSVDLSKVHLDDNDLGGSLTELAKKIIPEKDRNKNVNINPEVLNTLLNSLPNLNK